MKVDDSEHLSDPLDVANRSAQRLNDSAIAERQVRAAPQQVRNPDGSWPEPECRDCGDEIAPLRLEAIGAVLCVHCANVRETARGGYRA